MNAAQHKHAFMWGIKDFFFETLRSATNYPTSQTTHIQYGDQIRYWPRKLTRRQKRYKMKIEEVHKELMREIVETHNTESIKAGKSQEAWINYGAALVKSVHTNWDES